MSQPPVIIVMGVSGCGKTLVGQMLARRLGCRYSDADGYHPPANKAKMGRGEPLTEKDRKGWLDRLAKMIACHNASNGPLVLACSALRRTYRDQLRVPGKRVEILYLRGSFQLIQNRLNLRRGHFMPASLLRSQFETLEEPAADEPGATVDIHKSPREIVNDAMDRWGAERRWLGAGGQWDLAQR